jgi:cytochrome c551/c552
MQKYFKPVFITLSLLVLLRTPMTDIIIGQEIQVSLPEDPLRGRLIFEQKGCIRCHAIYGYGGDVAPDLGEEQFLGSFLDLASVMWNHSPQMNRKMRQIDVPRPQFSQQEMEELIAYLYYLPYLGKPGDATKGMVLFSAKGCLKCHSVGSKGGEAGPELDMLKIYMSPLYMAQAMWNHGPAMDKLMQKMGAKRPWLSGQEIVDLSAYIRQISQGGAREKIYMSPGNPKIGKQVFAQKGCIQCHAVAREGGELAPDLADVEFKKSVTEIAGILWNHGTDMWVRMERKGVARPQFNAKEMADLIAYLYFIAFMDQPGEPEKGKAVFLNKGCASCHSTSEKEQLIGPDLSLSKKLASPIALVQIMWNHAPIMKTRMLEKDLPWPEFKLHEMSDLYSYLQNMSNKSQK